MDVMAKVSIMICNVCVLGVSHLEAVEQVKADCGYLDKAPLNMKCPGHLIMPEDRETMMKKV